MKMEKLNADKIKITLSCEEFNDWQINLDSLTYNSPEAQDFFWTIIRQAESELDFVIDDSHLMVEAAMKEDAFTIIVSKVTKSVTDTMPKVPRIQMKKSEPKICKAPRINKYSSLYRFECLNDAVNACCCVNDIFDGYSRLYKHNGRFYLLLICMNGMEECVENNLSEYGEMVENATIYEGMLTEYGEVLIPKDAVQIMYGFF